MKLEMEGKRAIEGGLTFASCLSLFNQEQCKWKVFALIDQRNWEEVRRCLNSPNGYSLCQERDMSNMTPLALAIGLMAPLSVIEDLLRIADPSMPLDCDDFGATALHVGCLNGASFECVDFLLSNHPNLAEKLDFDGRSALHHAIEFSCLQDFTGEYGADIKLTITPYNDVIRRLCETAPKMIHVQDKSGDTPIDLVQIARAESRLDLPEEDEQRLDDLYHILRNTGIRLYRENKKRWEAEGLPIRQQQRTQKRMEEEGTLPTASESQTALQTAGVDISSLHIESTS